jgi:hypothetical protein
MERIVNNIGKSGFEFKKFIENILKRGDSDVIKDDNPVLKLK